jgi:hypothetical protein
LMMCWESCWTVSTKRQGCYWAWTSSSRLCRRLLLQQRGAAAVVTERGRSAASSKKATESTAVCQTRHSESHPISGSRLNSWWFFVSMCTVTVIMRQIVKNVAVLEGE